MEYDSVSTVTVDSYSTLVDIGSQEAVLEAHVDGLDDAEAVSQLWRAQYLQYSMIANDIDAYQPFWDLIGQGLRYALEANGYDVPKATRDEIRRTVYEDELTIFDDVEEGIERITDAGYEVYIVSNGSPEMLEHLVAAAGLGDIVTDAISAHEVETYKPDAAIYEHAAERTDTPIEEILHASGGGMRDVWGAKHAGMSTAWVSRPEAELPTEELGPDPDIVIDDFHDLADRLE